MMRDIDTINDAMDDARAVLHSYMWPGPRSPQLVLQRMLEILDHEDVGAAQERLRKGYGRLRLVE
jgi:hypothetical protein